MRMIVSLPVFLMCALAFTATAEAGPKVFAVDKNHSYFQFKASTVLFEVPGQFDQYKVTLAGDPDTGADANLRIEINARSINTQNSQRDEHLKSPDFFDANQYLKIVFSGSKVSKQGNQVTVEGSLDMHGVKKPFTIPFTEVVATNGAGRMQTVYKANLTLNRKDFGIGADSVAAKISLADEVQVNVLLAGFWEDPGAAVPADAAGKAKEKKKGGKQ